MKLIDDGDMNFYVQNSNGETIYQLQNIRYVSHSINNPLNSYSDRNVIIKKNIYNIDF